MRVGIGGAMSRYDAGLTALSACEAVPIMVTTLANRHFLIYM
jgi:hypothetical protein